MSDPGLRALLAPGGNLVREGHLLYQPALSATLGEVALEGWHAMYSGALATRLARGLAEVGSVIDASDLAEFEPTRQEPLTAAFGGLDIATSSPNSQGFFLLEALGILERTATRARWRGSSRSPHRTGATSSPIRRRCRSVPPSCWRRAGSTG
jgi:gamma-glutamyltranspeptidase